MNIFEQVKSRLYISDVVKFYGLQINHSGMCNCPFHDDKTPSMKIYENNFYCFGCGEHGDVIGFTAKLFGISQLEAAKKLNHDFGLHIETDKSLSQNQITITNMLNSVNIQNGNNLLGSHYPHILSC